MVRCGCATDRCNCRIIGGDGVEVAGNGSDTNPYVVSVVEPTAGGGGGGERFSGEIVAYAGPIAPVGWMLCDGSAVSRTVYAALYTAIGVAYGAGDGSTTFNLPDLTGRFPIGVDGGFPRGQSGGSDVLTEEMLPEHTHSIDHNHPSANTSSDGTHDHQTFHNSVDGTSSSTFREAQTSGRVQDRGLSADDGAHSHTVDLPAFTGESGAAGSPTPDPALPPYQAVSYIIKA